MRNRSGYLAAPTLGVLCALLCAPAAGQGERATAGVESPAADVGTLLGATSELEEALEIEAARSQRAGQAFGASLSAADRRELQGACTALIANPNDAAASRRLEQMMARYRDNNGEAIMRFCLDPTIAQLRADVRTSRRTLERISATGDTQANIHLQNTLQKQQQLEQMISNIMKAGHDTAKNAISNVR